MRAAVSPPTGSTVERPQRSEDERPWRPSRADAGSMRRRNGCLVDGLLQAGVEVGSSSITSNRWPWAARGLGCRSSLRRAKAAWSCAAAAGRAQSSGRPRRQAGVMTHTSTRRAAPEPFILPPPLTGPGSGPGRRAGRSRPGSAACGRRRRGVMPVPRRSAMRWKQAACLLPPGSRPVASTAAQRTSRGPCLVIGPPGHGGVGFVVVGGGSCPGARLRCAGEAVDVADLGHEDAPPAPDPTPRGGLDGEVADLAAPTRRRPPARAS